MASYGPGKGPSSFGRSKIVKIASAQGTHIRIWLTFVTVAELTPPDCRSPGCRASSTSGGPGQCASLPMRRTVMCSRMQFDGVLVYWRI